MMPPPNVTAVLHMGHGLNNTVQDVLVRFERMRGRRVLWVPGTDHAGIATQNVVERLLAKEGHTRFDLGREAFVERVWSFVRRDRRRHPRAAQGHRLLAPTGPAPTSRSTRSSRAPCARRSCACTRRGSSTAATTSSTGARAASPRSPTRKRRRRRRTGRSGTCAIRSPTGAGTSPWRRRVRRRCWATPRVAVHPEDERYRDLVGRELRLPMVDRLIPIVADDAVDPAFGTGAVKVTPAHDPTDFEIGRRHAPAHRHRRA